MQAAVRLRPNAVNFPRPVRHRTSRDVSLVGDELLVAVFAQFPQKEFRVQDDDAIVRALYRAKKTGRFNKFFRHYAFDVDGLTPSSRAISQALGFLHQTRLMGRMNPDLVRYSISESLGIRYEQYIKPKIAGNESELIQLAKAVESELGITSNSKATKCSEKKLTTTSSGS